MRAALLIVTLLFAGCASLFESTDASRQGAKAKVLHHEVHNHALASTIIILSSGNDDLISRIELSEHAFRMRTGESAPAGMGAIVSEDGYLLSASHCFGKFNLAISHHEGKANAFAVRFVADLGNDVSLAKIERSGGSFFTISESTQKEVFSVGILKAGELVVFQGLMNELLSSGDDVVSNLPLRRGDSGAPVFLDDGGLIAINSRIDWNVGLAHWNVIKRSSKVNAAKLRAAILQDRKLSLTRIEAPNETDTSW